MILITRPYPGAYKTAVKLSEAGFRCVNIPFLRIEKNNFSYSKLEQYSILIITSQNVIDEAARIANELGLKFCIKVYAIGQCTAKLLRKIGFKNIKVAQNNVFQLMKMIRSDVSLTNNMLYLRGTDITFDIATTLRLDGYKIDEAVVYKSYIIEDITQEQRKIITEEVKIILFFSVRTAISFKHIANKYKFDLMEKISLSFSQNIANIIQDLNWNKSFIFGDDLVEKIRSITSGEI